MTELCHLEMLSSLPEDIEEIEYPQDHSHITRRQECSQVLHGVVQMPGEAVLYQQGREIQDVQQQLLQLVNNNQNV